MDRYERTLALTDHRPWPMPDAAWTWRQSWCDLAFLHWPLAVEVARPLVPEPLEIDLFDGQTWVGVVPFRMEGVMRRPLPDLPGVSAFPELNVRLYVTLDGKPGVWFLSLDATNALAVAAARQFFHLPYHRADISIERAEDSYRYHSIRDGARGEAFTAVYRPASAVYSAELGTLEHWLTERYCLYAGYPDGSVYRTEVHHAQWPLQTAEAEVTRNTLLAAFGSPVPGPPVLAHFAERVDVVIWPSYRAA